MIIKQIYFSETGEILTDFTNKDIMQFSHNAVLIEMYIPRWFIFDASAITFKNTYGDFLYKGSVVVDALYYDEQYYRLCTYVGQSLTQDFGKLRMWLTLRNDNMTMWYSKEFNLNVKEASKCDWEEIDSVETYESLNAGINKNAAAIIQTNANVSENYNTLNHKIDDTKADLKNDVSEINTKIASIDDEIDTTNDGLETVVSDIVDINNDIGDINENIAVINTKFGGYYNKTDTDTLIVGAKAYTDNKVADLVGSSPDTLDTLNELATALGNDPNFATTITTSLGTKANKLDVYTKAFVDTELGKKVDKISGKGLSANDYTNTDKSIVTNADTTYEKRANRNAPNGYAGLGSDGKISASILPETGVAVDTALALLGEDNIPLTADDILEKFDNKQDLIPIEYLPYDNYLTFESTESFTLKTYNESKNWNGTLYYLHDTTEWLEWVGTTISSNNDNKIYLKGVDNSIITGNAADNRFVLTGNNISCTGNIESLLDYNTVSIGEHPLMESYCYKYMFQNCNNLVTAPNLPTTVLASDCYNCMFYNCTSLTQAPELPAITLANNCYANMFQNCSSLVTAPNLPTTVLASSCYNSMFFNCTGLTQAPELPAITLASTCYKYMFYGCTSLVTAPELPATTLAEYCYFAMFRNCTNLVINSTPSAEYPCAWKIPATTAATDWNANTLEGTIGDVTELELNTTYYTAPYVAIPEIGDNYLTFESADNFTLKTNNESTNWNGILYYSHDTKDWNIWNGTLINSKNNKLYLKGIDNSIITGNNVDARFVLTGTNISCSGNIESLLDYNTVAVGEHPVMESNCYKFMFYNCTSLVNVPELPAITLTNSCYRSIFQNCNNLVTAPNLPTTTLASYCYANMFEGCTSLVNVPQLPATTLTNSCYRSMFCGCTSLVNAPNLPTITLAEYCYANMFEGCTSLVNAPELPAITLANNCYANMFYGCTNLVTAPNLPATTLASYCYYYMFYGCTSLVTAPNLPAITLAEHCYKYMFYGCTSLVTAPELPAITLAEYCYYYMFYGCTSLVTAPQLPAITLANNCYYCMFEGCTSLTQAPELPATTLAEYCYKYMFEGCTSLIQAPELPATVLASECYNGMFKGCTGLTQAPQLPATVLASVCYRDMFQNCSSLVINSTPSTGYDREWTIPATVPATDWNIDSLMGTNGDVTSLELNTTYYTKG